MVLSLLTYVGGALLSLSHIIPCLSSIQIIGRLFLNPYLSCFLYVCSVCLRRFIFQVKKKNNSTASILNANNFYPKECTLFEKRLCFKPKYIHFVYSFLACGALSSCLCRGEYQFFFLTRSTRTCRCHGK